MLALLRERATASFARCLRVAGGPTPHPGGMTGLDEPAAVAGVSLFLLVTVLTGAGGNALAVSLGCTRRLGAEAGAAGAEAGAAGIVVPRVKL